GTQLPTLPFAWLAVSDVKRFLVRRQQHCTGADRVVGKPTRDPGAPVIAFEPQHGAMIEEWKDRWPERNDWMARVGEIDAVLPVDDESARLVVILAIEQGVDRNSAAVGSELNEPPPAFLRAVHFAVRAEGESVYPVGVTAKLGDCLADMIEPKQPALIHSAEQHLAVDAVPDDAASRPLARPDN